MKTVDLQQEKGDEGRKKEERQASQRVGEEEMELKGDNVPAVWYCILSLLFLFYLYLYVFVLLITVK